MQDRARLTSPLLAVVAAVSTLLAVAWRAAEEGRGLDLADLRSVLIVALAVGAAGAWVAARGWGRSR